MLTRSPDLTINTTKLPRVGINYASTTTTLAPLGPPGDESDGGGGPAPTTVPTKTGSAGARPMPGHPSLFSFVLPCDRTMPSPRRMPMYAHWLHRRLSPLGAAGAAAGGTTLTIFALFFAGRVAFSILPASLHTHLQWGVCHAPGEAADPHRELSLRLACHRASPKLRAASSSVPCSARTALPSSPGSRWSA